MLATLFTKHPVHECHFFEKTHKAVSPTHNELVLAHLVLCTELHFEGFPLSDL